MAEKKYLIITYDYELFLGSRSGTVEDCQIKPVERTLAILSKNRLKAVFFTDTLQLVRLRELANSGNKKAAGDFEKLKRQFADIILQGHYIYPHIHPHWYHAHYDEATHQWNLSDISLYRFHQCTAGQQHRAFSQSIEILKEMIHPVAPGYCPEAFRAGGWCIQPFSDFRPYFTEHRIRYDMSVLPGFYSFTNAQYFDFTAAPQKPAYRFGKSESIEEADGPFIQLTVSSVSFGSLHRLLDRIWLKFAPVLVNNNRPASGSGHASRKLEPQPLTARKGFDVLENYKQRIAVELLTPVSMPLYKKFLKENEYMHWLSHPKMETPYQQNLFDRFLRYACSEYDVESDFKVFLRDKGFEA